MMAMEDSKMAMSEMTQSELHDGCPCCKGGTYEILRELTSAAEPFAWMRPYRVDDDEVVPLRVTGAQMKRLMAALDH